MIIKTSLGDLDFPFSIESLEHFDSENRRSFSIENWCERHTSNVPTLIEELREIFAKIPQKEFEIFPFEDVKWDLQLGNGIRITDEWQDRIYERCRQHPTLRPSFLYAEFEKSLKEWAVNKFGEENLVVHLDMSIDNTADIFKPTTYIPYAPELDYWSHDSDWGLHEADDSTHIVKWGQMAIKLGWGIKTDLPNGAYLHVKADRGREKSFTICSKKAKIAYGTICKEIEVLDGFAIISPSTEKKESLVKGIEEQKIIFQL